MNRSDYIKILQRYLVDSFKFSYQFENGLLPKDLDAFCSQRVEDSLFPVAIMTIIGALIYNIIAGIVEPWFPLLDRFSNFLPYYHVFLCILLLIAVSAIKPGKYYIFYVFLSFYFFASNLAYTVICRSLLQVPSYGTPELFYFLYHNCVGIVLIAFFPHHRFFPNAIYTAFSILVSFWMLIGVEDQFLGCFLISLVFGITLFLKTMIWSIVIFGYRMEYFARERLLKAERALIAKEFDLARQIQDSIKPPQLTQWQGHLLHCYSLKHESVGGDWVGIHQDMGSRRLIIVVADAMGKGLQASLVIHAVQSLWAEHVSKSTYFDPEQWIKSVNEALFFMGRLATHMVTLGLVVLQDDGHGMYWSAGHVPLFLVNENDGKKVRSILSLGAPLGVFPHSKITGVSFNFDNAQYVLLGSDGVFYKGTRHTKREILNIIKNIEVEGSLAYSQINIQDDKTLLTLCLSKNTSIQSIQELKKVS